MQKKIEQLTAEARHFDDMEESLVKEIIREKDIINKARLAPFRIADLQKQLAEVKNQQARVEAQIIEAQMEQIMQSGKAVIIKGAIGGVKQ